MLVPPRISVYVDWANLDKASRSAGFDLDYAALIVWFRRKFDATDIYLFLGFMERMSSWYLELQSIGYLLVFKDILVTRDGSVKGNCDAEMVLKAVTDFYEARFDSCVLVSSDGDFACLADFLKSRKVIRCIVSPYGKGCSILLKRLQVPIIDFQVHFHKFSTGTS